MKVIVCDAQQRSALATVRSLRRAGHQVMVAASEHPSLAGVARGVSLTFLCADPATSPGLFSDQVLSKARETGADLIIPLTDASCLSLARADNGGGLVFQPTLSQMDTAADKMTMTELAGRLGVPVPATTIAAGAEGASSPTFPVIVKPRRSRVRVWGRFEAMRVRRADDPGELAALLRSLPEGAFPILLQEQIAGEGLGYFALCRDGEVLAEFFHHRLRELPPTGGVSTLSEATPPDPEVRRHARALLEHLRWTGPAMVEFKRGSDGRPYYIELNGRLWGSLQLAIDAGVDFPALMVRAAAGETFPLPGYRPAARLRHWAGDVESLAVVAVKGAPAPLTRAAYWKAWFTHGGRAEVERLSDPRPALHEWRLFFAKFLKLGFGRLFPPRCKGIIHSHTTHSHDGELEIAAFADHLERAGLHFAVITEHEDSMDEEKMRRLVTECRKLSRPGFVLIPGVEFATPIKTHILGIGVRAFFDEHDPARIVAGIHERGGIAVLAHPDIRDFEQDPEFLGNLDGAEAWNTVHDGPFVPSSKNIECVEAIRRTNPRLLAYGGIDFHRAGHYRGAHVVVDARPDEDSILAALRDGRFRMAGWLFGYDAHHRFTGLERAWVAGLRKVIAVARPAVRVFRRMRDVTVLDPVAPPKRRVAHTIETGNPGGAERVLLSLVDELPAERFVSSAVLAKDGWLADQLAARGIHAHIAPLGNLWNPRHILSLTRFLRRERVSLLQSHELYMNLHGAVAARIAGVRHAAVVHGNLSYMAPWYRRLGYNIALMLGSRIVTVSYATREDIARILRIPRHKIDVFHNGVPVPAPYTDADRAAARGLLGVGGEPVIAVIGSLYPVKGHAVLFQVLPDILAAHPNLKLMLIGRGRDEYEQSLRRAAAPFGDSVVFCGFRDDVPALLPGIDILAVPSLYEGLSLTLCEAMAAGIPAVATAVGGNTEVVTHQEDGLLVPASDHAALADALLRLLGDAELRARLGRAARETAVRHFSMEQMIRRYWGLYAQMLGDDPPPRPEYTPPVR